jgi:transcriptional regulator with XRE-family HTH domain
MCGSLPWVGAALPDRPSHLRLQLAAELRTARNLAGVNQRDLAAELSVSQSLVSRAERGERLLSRPVVAAWLRTVDASTDVRQRVLDLTEAAHTESRTWSDLLASQQHLQHVSEGRNAAARTVMDFAPTVLPGLLQTAEYARHVIPLADLASRVDHDAALAARIRRQEVLRRPGRDFRFLITERLLHWEPGPGTLTPQLAHLVATAELDTVRIGVLPEAYAGVLSWHNFVVRRPADGSSPYVATELFHGDQTIDDPESVALYLDAWERMWTAAATGDDAVRLIRAAGGLAH